MTEAPKNKKRQNDLFLVATLLLIALVGLLLVFLFRTEGAYCIITQNGKEIGRLSLTKDQTVTFHTENGDGYNIVTVKNGQVSVSEASCPDKVCVRSYSVKYHGQTIACLPNGFIVTVYGGEDGLDIIV